MSFRRPIAALSVSAVAFAALVMQEGWSEKAIIPVKGDVPTVGFGSTVRDDGTPVQMGDSITPPQAVKRALTHIQKDETGLKRCVTGPLTQGEYDVLVDFTYQYGIATACKSSMVKNINAGRYREACDAYARYRFVGVRDCSLSENRRICGGVWTRSLARQADCHASSEGDGK